MRSRIMGPGVRHAVFTIQLEGYEPGPVVMTGFHFLHRAYMVASLFSSISHRYWHDVWTNAVHDDQSYEVAILLCWQILREAASLGSGPFIGNNLYALLLSSSLCSDLVSLPTWILRSPQLQDESWMTKTLLRYRKEIESAHPQAAIQAAHRKELAKQAKKQLSLLSTSHVEAARFAQFEHEVLQHVSKERMRRIQYNASLS